MIQTAVYASIAETTDLNEKQVKGDVQGIVGVASEQLKKNGTFQFAGMRNMKLKKKPATPVRKGNVGPVIGILTQMKESMAKDLAAMTATEEQSIVEYNALIAAKRKQIQADTKRQRFR